MNDPTFCEWCPGDGGMCSQCEREHAEVKQAEEKQATAYAFIIVGVSVMGAAVLLLLLCLMR